MDTNSLTGHSGRVDDAVAEAHDDERLVLADRVHRYLYVPRSRSSTQH